MVDVFATEQLAALQRSEVSAAELLGAHLAQIDKHNGTLNAVIWRDVDAARTAAAEIDSPPTPEQPLLGLPMTVKESFNLAGAPTTWGFPHMVDNVADEDAVVVERSRAAGAIVYGKTNVPLNLSDFQSYNDIYGTTNNPWDTSRTPGGSSGGAAVALATGMSALEIGSDIAGSIRNPAHYCGLFGHKPTWGLVPPRGHALPGAIVDPDIAVVGPLARSAADLDLALDVLAHPDRLQEGIRYDLPRFAGVQGRRVAVWADDPVAPVSRAVSDRVRAVGRTLAELGAHVVDDARPAFDADHASQVYVDLLHGFLGATNPYPVWEKERRKAGELPDDDPRVPTFRARTMSHHTWLRLHNQRDVLRWAWRRFFDEYDVVVMPISATPAFGHDHSPMSGRTIDVDGAQQGYMQQAFWAGLTGVAHLPSTVIPTGPDENGLPIGVQLVGPAFGDRITTGLARVLENAGYAYQRPPGY
jgi:amidase